MIDYNNKHLNNLIFNHMRFHHTVEINIIMMKKTIFSILLALTGIVLTAQQSPLSESYFSDKYNLAPSYAGSVSPKYLFLGYRSDWSGIDGGPMTFRLSYNDKLMQNAGYGAKFIYDVAGIFKQLYASASYSYDLKVAEEHHIMFGLSAGIYHNSINISEYYSDPDYNLDPALIQDDISSKIKFMSDVSLVYSWNGLEAGGLFSNISFGDATYEDVNLKYNPLSNYQLHLTYLWPVAEDWDIIPLALFRGGKYLKSQFEMAAQVVWQKRFMASLVFRDPGVLGFGAGANIDKGIKLYYNFNFATNVSMGIFNNHEVTLGFNIFEYIGKN
jgi:type IX secretion system PorP/SprF family membrane protein